MSGITYGFSVMLCNESSNIPFTVFRMRFPQYCSDAYNLSRYPQWDTLNSQAVEQANSCLKSLKRSLSYISEKNFMTHCKVFIGIEIRYGVSSSSPKV
ncbi:uncharacterized protein [Pocillopora verrucosa]|uniref:uncharacterized protein n=1 Tax=Pocillopora verrucosa TaxID=203993 RepID=UPI00333ECA81